METALPSELERWQKQHTAEHALSVNTQPPAQSESEKFFAHLNNGEVLFFPEFFFQDGQNNLSHYRIVITPKEAGK